MNSVGSSVLKYEILRATDKRYLVSILIHVFAIKCTKNKRAHLWQRVCFCEFSLCVYLYIMHTNSYGKMYLAIYL